MAAQPNKPVGKSLADEESEAQAKALLAELEHPKTTADKAEDEAPLTGGAKVASIAGGILKILINWILTPAAIVLVLHFFVFQAFQVDGYSMFPTLHDHDYLIISKVGASIAKLRGGSRRSIYYVPKRGEIIVFIAPPQPDEDYVKRVVGLPGDRVVVKDATVTVYNDKNPQGFNPDTDHQITTPIYGEVDTVVPKGSVFVMGDNRFGINSFDSREWGMLPTGNIIGVAILRLLPVSSLRFLDIPLYSLRPAP